MAAEPDGKRAMLPLWTRTIVLLLTLATGGFAGALFTAWWTNRTTTVSYSATSTTLSADPKIKGIVPGIKIQIGAQEVPAIHTHSVEFRAQSGPYADHAEIAMLFPIGVQLLTTSATTETSSPLHQITCKDRADGAVCDLKPLSAGNGYFRISFATTGSHAGPRVMTVARGIELVKSEEVW